MASLFYHAVSADNLSPLPTSLLSWIMAHPLWRDLPADIFAGQIIASVIVLTFVAVFLLREWISQNARPGVFEDDDFPVEDQPAQPLRAANAPPPPAEPAQPPMQNGEPQPPPQAPPQPRPLLARPRNEGHRVGEARRRRLPVESRKRDKGKARQLEGIQDLDPRSRRRAHWKERASKSPAQSEAFTRRVYEARASRRRTLRLDSAPSASPGNSQNGASQGIAPGTSHFQFTFKPLEPREKSPSDSDFGDASSGDSNNHLEPYTTEVGDAQTTVDVDTSMACASDVSELEDDPFAQSSSDITPEELGGEVSTEPPNDSAEPSSLQDSDYASGSLFDVARSESYHNMEAEAGPSNLGSHFPRRDNLEEQDSSDGILVEDDGTVPNVGEDNASESESDTQSESDMRDGYDRYFANEGGEDNGVDVVEQHVQEDAQKEHANLDQHVEQHFHQADEEEEEDEDEMPTEDEDEEDDGDAALGVDRAEVVPQGGVAGDELNQNGIAIGAEQVVAAGAAGAEVNEEMDGNVEDDMEGAMEGLFICTQYISNARLIRVIYSYWHERSNIGRFPKCKV